MRDNLIIPLAECDGCGRATDDCVCDIEVPAFMPDQKLGDFLLGMLFTAIVVAAVLGAFWSL